MQIKIAGVGRHTVAVILQDPEQLVRWSKCEIAVLYLTLLTITLPRLAILSLYLRFLKDAFYRRMTYLVGVLLVCYCLAFMLALTFICIPFAYNWNKTIKGGRCGNEIAGIRASTVPSFVIDIIMLILPLPVIWKLQTSRFQKLGFTFTFLTGSL